MAETKTKEEAVLMPVVVSQVDFVFPAKVIGTLLLPWETLCEKIPIDQKGNEEFFGKAKRMFESGAEVQPVAFKEGIDPELANRHLNAILRSFEPTHEHKITGVAYLLKCWIK
jgi:hypothetical protein